MNIVERPGLAPGYCMATLAAEDPRGFIDTGNNPATVDPRVYISVSWIEQMGRELGMVDGDLLDTAEQRIEDLEADLAEADKLAEASHLVISKMPKPKKKGDPVVNRS